MHMAAGRGADDPIRQRLAGLLTHEFRSAWWALDALIADTNDDSLGTEGHFITTMLAKRQVILSSIRIVELAMELLGSQTYMRALPFEQALRDVRAGITHPLAPEKTLLEVGQSALNFFANQQSSR
jgi:alkylation response protein AidB-like acyl-CoA dehydrogenase